MIGPGGSIQLMRVFGIRIGVNPSWFLVLFIFIFWLSGSFRAALNSSGSTAYITAVAAALLFFFSLILHELGHALVAKRNGIEIAGIDLWFFGGVARMSRDTDSPGVEFRVSAAGPAVTLLIVAICVGIGSLLVGPSHFFDSARLQSDAASSPGVLLVSFLASINALVFVFNLIPAFPLDGGRIARSIAWKVTGDRSRATKISATLGQVFAWILMGVGVVWLINFRSLTGLYWIVLGFFLLSAARGAVVQTNFQDRIADVTVADIMDREPVTIAADLTADHAYDDYFLRYQGWGWFPVVDNYHRFVGLIHRPALEHVVQLGGSQAERAVRELMEPDDGNGSVGADAPLEQLLGSEPLRNLGALFAVDGQGVLRGVVTMDQVRRALQSAASR
ncbi:MAG TPA: site-2 protease family protein [Solirubrobacteraceae bacterium]|jgi:Zn-dependent protease|nr:site-2 protease family protein [Solirubrobacteraceae bacterium]